MPTILGLTPFHEPDVPLARAIARAGAGAALDLGHDLGSGLDAARALARGVDGFGVRVHADALPDPADLPDAVEFVILPAGADPSAWAPRRTVVEATSLAEALAAVEAGADEVIAVGAEAAGRVGGESTFVLLQRLLAAVDVPVLARGGIGPATAAACAAGGAAGVVLDAQLALLPESSAPADVRRALEAMDGSETAVVGGHRVYTRPDLSIVAESRDLAPGDVAARLGDDLESRLLPVGEDGGFARLFADRYGTVAGAVRGLRADVVDALRRARQTRPLAPGAPLAAAHGTRFPILQGPMTRVSDTPEFAAAVAEAGALPFLALSMLRGERLTELLEATREALGERPWGVGILGFVQPEVRAEQLAAIEAARPPFALIAGGRPAQARALESRGIDTWLHVPSAGLLDLFLKDGARRFVFEGRECGGHVGPLSSFALWQSQVERLLAFDDLDDVSVAFAGGIHDARSAAMVAALAAPLAARGANVGVLMGTAYLFTPEAVEAGAILASYQEAAIACAETSLLETGPGHATRCVDTPYARAFRDERRRLEAEGRPGREVWETLERMNLGRLRVATKGIERRGDDLVEVDAGTRGREGMYMIGQVAALRGEVVPIEALHRDVSKGATARIDALEDAASSPSRRPEPVRVAIVGMAGIFPGAPDVETYWSNVVRGVDSIREVSPERWNPDLYFDPDGEPGRTTPSKWGGFLDEMAFDPVRYGIPPRSMGSIDPIQLLSLEVARRAMEDAGYPERPFDRDRTGIVFGAEGGTDLSKAYGFRALWPQYAGELPDALDRALPVPSEDSFPGVLTNVISGRIANRLDLGGENYTVNAACASSLAALSIGVQWLAAASCDMVIVGGADVHNSIGDYLMFSSVHALSPSGRCATFDRSADGIALGEGIGAVVLKRLEDAEADGDRVWAVIEGVGGSSDGKSMGLTAPRPEGQVRALDRAYDAARTSPSEVTLMEAHGTGTVVGDRTELQTMERVFRDAGARAGSVALGSVKSQVGHLKGAAGIASVIKVARALHARTLPPTLHVERPSASWEPESSPFTLSRAARPWIAERRVAAVSAFGFGGTNYHAVLSEAPGGEEPPAAGHAEWPAELFLLRGADPSAARARAAEALRALEAEPAPALREVARATSCGGDGPVAFAFGAASREEAIARLGGVARGEDAEGVHARDEAVAGGRVAFLFPGQGSQYAGMLADVFVAFPRLAELLALEPDVAGRIHPPDAFTPRENAAREAALTRTDIAQVALGICDVAMLRLLRALAIEPDLAAGHSYGELVALHAAGAWGVRDLLDLSAARARAILEAAGDDSGAMAAVAAAPEAIEPVLEGLDGVWPANLNAADQTILSGRTEAIETAVERLGAAGMKATRLNVACAFHSPIVAAARDALGAALDAVDVRPLEAEVWSNAKAAPYPVDPAGVRALCCDQLESPVLWRRQIEAMHEAGARVFVEVGPGRVLTGLVGRVLGGRPHAAIPLDARGEPGLPALVDGLARLAACGAELDPAPLWAGRCESTGDLADLAPPEIPATAWWVDGQRAKPVRGEVPEGGYVPVTGPVVDGAGAPAPAGSSGGAEAAVLEYLRNVRALVEAQRDVVLGYLGAEIPTRPAAEGVPSSPAAGGLEATPARTAGREAPAPRTGAPAAATPAGSGNGAPPEATPAAPPGVTEALLGIVSARTGYPTEMLELDLDLEADLSIDSIKRLEILGTLDEEVGLGAATSEARDAMLEELATIRTLRGIVEWVEGRAPGSDPEDPAGGAGPDDRDAADGPADDEPEPTVVPGTAGGSAGPGLFRSVLEVRDAPPVEINGASIVDRTFLITDDGGGVAEALARRLAERGAEVEVVGSDAEVNGADGVIHLAPLRDDAGPEEVKALYRLARGAVAGNARWMLAATGLGGAFGRGANGRSRAGTGGVSGLLKSLALEWPDGRVRAIDLDPTEAVDDLAARIVDEVLSVDGPVDVAYGGGSRRFLEVVPHDDGGEEAAPLPLDPDSVVLVTGGGRGVTARVSIALARATGCRLEIVGRTPEPDGEEPAGTAGIDDPVALRRRLAELDPSSAPAGIDRRARRLLAGREVAATLAAVREAGSEAIYHPLDVRDSEALSALVDDVYARHGRLDGVIHGAGTIEDKRIVDKTPDSFDRVFDTKVQAALTLAGKLRDDVRFVVFFSSVAGVFGNAGQTDYAAANEVLDHLARHLAGRSGTRAVSIAWGPWDEVGMVGPELRRAFERRGIGLIPVDEGVEYLLREIARPDGPSQIVVTRTPPAARG